MRPLPRPALRLASVTSGSASLSCAAFALAVGPSQPSSPVPLAISGMSALFAILGVLAWRAADAAKRRGAAGFARGRASDW